MPGRHGGMHHGGMHHGGFGRSHHGMGRMHHGGFRSYNSHRYGASRYNAGYGVHRSRGGYYGGGNRGIVIPSNNQTV